jgi:PTS system fructose-specific IIA component/PTS system nitrogen regulatory IIA component
MEMTRFLVRTAVLPSLAAGTRDDAIREMVASLAAAGAIEPASTDDIVAAVLRREQLGTTGIGNGLAIPHSRHPSVDRLIGTLGVCKRGGGIEFNSHDGQPVYAMVLIISPQDQPGPHLRALDSVVAAFRDESLLPRLQSCQTADDVWAVLTAG